MSDLSFFDIFRNENVKNQICLEAKKQLGNRNFTYLKGINGLSKNSYIEREEHCDTSFKLYLEDDASGLYTVVYF